MAQLKKDADGNVIKAAFDNYGMVKAMVSTEERLSQMEDSLKQQVTELRNKQNKMKREREELIRNDFATDTVRQMGLNLGDTYLIRGFSRALKEISVCLYRDSEHKGHGGDYLDTLMFTAKPYFQGDQQISSIIRTLGIFSDDLSVYTESNPEGMPPRCDMPAGSHYPLRGELVNTLTGLGLKVSADNGEDYSVKFGYVSGYGSVGRQNNKHVPVDHIIVTLDRNGCQQLRQIANHRNRYTKLVEKLEKKGALESHEFQQDIGADGFISRCYFVLNFKMVAKKVTDATEGAVVE